MFKLVHMHDTFCQYNSKVMSLHPVDEAAVLVTCDDSSVRLVRTLDPPPRKSRPKAEARLDLEVSAMVDESILSRPVLLLETETLPQLVLKWRGVWL